jgi:phospholipid-transporting ATPase
LPGNSKFTNFTLIIQFQYQKIFINQISVFSAKRMYVSRSYHTVQEIQKFNIPDYRPRMEQFQKAIRKVRAVQRLRKSRGFAFSQNESGQEAQLIRVYDTTLAKPKG